MPDPAARGTKPAPEPSAWRGRWGWPVAAVLLAAAFLADLDTGYELSASLFYLGPVAFAAWFLGRGPGLAMAAASSLAWLASQQLQGLHLSSPGLLYANAGVEWAIYSGAAWFVARVREDRERERQLLGHVAEARDALEHEFLAVGALQRGLLPGALPPIPGHAWDVHYATSTRAGGDYYDAFLLPEGRVGIFVADATGHGAPAAVLMGMARALIGAEPEALFPPERALARLNARLARILPTGWFLTACCAVLEPAGGRLVLSLAGHDAPVLVRARDGRAEQVAAPAGLLLGPFPEAEYAAGTADLEPGDTLMFFTDGVTETASPDFELFGVERLCRTLDGTADLPLADVRRRVLDALARHAAGAPLQDDTTLLLLRRA